MQGAARRSSGSRGGGVRREVLGRVTPWVVKKGVSGTR